MLVNLYLKLMTYQLQKRPQKIENTISLLIMQKGIMNVVENRI